MPGPFEIAFFNIAFLLPPVAVLVGLLSLVVPRGKAARNVESYKHAA